MKKAKLKFPKALTEKSLVRGKKTTIGVLALQGDFLEHIKTLNNLGVSAKEIRLPKDLDELSGIIIPGGESTTIAYLLDIFKLRTPLAKKIKKGMPVWGTCAGMILLAKKLVQDRPEPLGLMDMIVNRNAYGRQIDSFTTPITISPLGKKQLVVTFIRAPIIEKVGESVEILSKTEDGQIVAVRQKKMLATAFHTELSTDARFHEYFISDIVKT